jgi:hypothetical protein
MRTFKYVFKDGAEIEASEMTNSFMRELIEQHGECLRNGFHEFMGVGQRSTLGVIGGSNTRGDGFKTGYHYGLGMDIKSPQHYKDVLKEKGMHEVGNSTQKDTFKRKSVIDDKAVKEIIDMGADLSGNEISYLKEEIP